MPFCVLASMCQFGFGFEVKWLAVIRLKVTGCWSKVFRLRVIRFYPFYLERRRRYEEHKDD